MIDLTSQDKARFENSFTVTPGCWPWNLSRSPKGYGQFHIKSYPYRASRVSYLLYEGEIPDGLHVLHRCDNPCCVNPSHLFLGTNLENMKDRDGKGRHRVLRGSLQKSAKLTEQEVLSILSDKRTHLEVANDYGVSRSLIGAIKSGKRWPQMRAVFQANAKQDVTA